jgi:hypothetical protein
MAIPVRSKSAAYMLTPMRQLFKRAPRRPIRLHTGKEKEFYNATVSKSLREQGVELLLTNSDYKGSHCGEFQP